MKLLLTVFIALALCTNRLVVADDHCTAHNQFRAPFYPGRSCKDIYIMNPESREIPGYYWIIDSPTNVYCGMNYTGLSCEDIYYNYPETGNKLGYYPINNTKWTFCNMTAIATPATVAFTVAPTATPTSAKVTPTDTPTTLTNDPTAELNYCAGVEGNWSKIGSINISAGDKCPAGWSMSSYNGTNFCRAPSDSTGCYSTIFSTNGLSYQQICGRARGYQKGSPNAFYPFHRNKNSIDSYYVDGLSITHGNPRQHIWTYAVGITDHDGPPSQCPCTAIPGPAPPSFVGSDYYCESGAVDTYDHTMYYLSDPLWDGAGCSVGNNCCSNANQPWFYHKANRKTQDDIEVRICRDENFSNDGILVDILKLYVQ